MYGSCPTADAFSTLVASISPDSVKAGSAVDSFALEGVMGTGFNAAGFVSKGDPCDPDVMLPPGGAVLQVR